MTDLAIYRLPDEKSQDGFISIYALVVNGVPITTEYEIHVTNSSPPLEWPEELAVMARGLETALKTVCRYRDARVHNYRLPGVSMKVPAHPI